MCQFAISCNAPYRVTKICTRNTWGFTKDGTNLPQSHQKSTDYKFKYKVTEKVKKGVKFKFDIGIDLPLMI